MKRGKIQLRFIYRDPNTKPLSFIRNDKFARMGEFQRGKQTSVFPQQETFKHLTTGGTIGLSE